MVGEIDVGQQMAQWAARMQSQGGGRQAWFEKPMNAGAANLSATVVGIGKNNIPSLAGTGRGMFGGASDKVGGFLPSVFDQIKACAQPLQQVTSFADLGHGASFSGGGSGGSFTSMVGSRGGEIEVG